jgi:hypothetical protein
MSHKNVISYRMFDEPLSLEAKYWLGFILADGCIAHDRLQINLSPNDIGHLEKFQSFLKGGNIHTYQTKGGSFGPHKVSSFVIVSKLLFE